MVKKETKPLTYDDVSKWPPVENVAAIALDEEAITPNKFAKDTNLRLHVSRKELKKKRKSKYTFVASKEMGQTYDQVIAVRGWKAPQQVAFPDKEGNPQDISVLPGLEVANRLAFLLEQAVKRKKENDRTSSPKDK